MPSKKPAGVYGTIDFAKSGRVIQNVRTLPDSQKGQEEEVGRLFSSLGSEWLPRGHSLPVLREDDHDIAYLTETGEVFATVQCTEVTYRDFTEPVSDINMRQAGSVTVSTPEGYRAIDTEMAGYVLISRLFGKLLKHYSKPAHGEFWLIVWTSGAGVLLSSRWEEGRRLESAAVRNGRLVAKWVGIEPFDKVFFFALGLKPTLIGARRYEGTLSRG